MAETGFVPGQLTRSRPWLQPHLPEGTVPSLLALGLGALLWTERVSGVTISSFTLVTQVGPGHFTEEQQAEPGRPAGSSTACHEQAIRVPSSQPKAGGVLAALVALCQWVYLTSAETGDGVAVTGNLPCGRSFRRGVTQGRQRAGDHGWLKEEVTCAPGVLLSCLLWPGSGSLKPGASQKGPGPHPTSSTLARQRGDSRKGTWRQTTGVPGDQLRNVTFTEVLEQARALVRPAGAKLSVTNGHRLGA